VLRRHSRTKLRVPYKRPVYKTALSTKVVARITLKVSEIQQKHF